jgi:hypothetical protein
MSKRSKSLAFVVCALLVTITATTALAGHQTSGVKSYTGCLVSGDGVMIKIKEGSSPRSACTGGQVEAHFSGGDITKISVGGGLTLPNGGDNGEVRIELAAGQALPQGCDDGEIAEWDTSPTPDRWVCGVDDDTTYSEGTGLDLSAGNAFSIDPEFRLPGKECSASGEFATGFDGDGVIQCSAPASSGIQAFSASRGAVAVAGLTTIISKTLSPGNYVLTAHVLAYNPSAAARAVGYCDISGDRGETSISETDFFENITLTSTIAHAGGAVLVTCTETSGNLDVKNASLTAIQVDSLG